MNRIESSFKELKNSGDKGVIPYLTVGYPSLEITEELVMALAESGATMVELGVPFSDPVADGPVIQAASMRSLQNKTTLADVLSLAKRLREKLTIPLLIMTYYNPVYAYGIERFIKEIKNSGIDGVIVPDLPLEESGPLAGSLKKENVQFIYMLSPTSTGQRIITTVQKASGFIYCVSTAGVTGARDTIPEEGLNLLARIRKLSKLPLALGFGISTPQQVTALGEDADAVIIGSAIIKLIEEGGSKDQIKDRISTFLGGFKYGVNGKNF
ncbi:MAG: tryptophan synthase subunit alpha [Bacillota bacterium]